MATFFKDFDKESKDHFSKRYSGGAWTIESKLKGRDGELVVNPNADGRGVKVDLERRMAAHGVTAVATARPGGLLGKVKWERAFGGWWHHVEFVVPCWPLACEGPCDGEMVYEGRVQGIAAMHDRITHDTVDGGVSFALTPNMSVGGGLSYGISERAVGSWSAGARLVAPSVGVLSVTTRGLERWAVGAVVDGRRFSWGTVKLASRVEYGRTAAKCDAVVGAELTLDGVPDTALCAKLDNNGVFGLGVIRHFRDAWRATLNVEGRCCGAMKVGLMLTRE